METGNGAVDVTKQSHAQIHKDFNGQGMPEGHDIAVGLQAQQLPHGGKRIHSQNSGILCKPQIKKIYSRN